MQEQGEHDRWDMTKISRVYLALGAVAMVAHLLLRNDQQRYLLYAAVALLAAFAMGLSAIVLRPDRRLWIPTVATFTFVGAAHVMHPDKAGTVASSSSDLLFQVFGLIGLVIIVLTLIGLVRARAYERLDGVVADALILALGAWIVGWVLFSPGRLSAEGESLPLAIGRGLAQPLAVVVFFLLVTVVLADNNRKRSLTYLSVAVAAVLVAQTAHSVSVSTQHHVPEHVMNAPLVFAAFMAGAGLLHPSVRQLFGPHGAAPSRPLLVRLLITTTAMVLPIVALSISDPNSTTDRVVRLVSASVLALAVMLRVMHAVRSNEHAQRELVRSARTDPLTRLPNRELVLEHIAQALSEAWRTNRRPTVLFIDVDRFKNVNDSLGHPVGDAVLRAVAERLTAAMPERAVVGRISGDEFVVVDPDTRNPAEALALAEVAWSVFREPMPLRQGDVFISASIGVANANPTSTSKADDLLRQADTAMYRAKDAGRNQIAMFDDTMLARVSQRLAMETALYRALERRELLLYHQPILDLDEGRVIGFEALMRWEQSDGTLVSPADFIPIAEETGTIVPIGAWALLEALTHLHTWMEEGICTAKTSVSVNVSPRQLHDPNFLSVVDEALRRSGMPAHQLWLEVTESVMITEPEMAKRTLQSLCEMGVRIAVDDFGTGYSSLSLLQQFPIHRIKIDRAFVSGVAEDAGARSLVRTIIAMGDSLGLDLVAEGVETIDQLRALHELGCAKAQGYLMSKPVPADAMRSTVLALDQIASSPMLKRRLPVG